MMQIRLPGLERLQQQFQRAPRRLDGELESALQQSLQLTEREVVRRTPTAQGRLRSAIQGEVRRSATSVTGTVTAGDVAYASFVEYDTAPHFPPLAPLEEWVRHRGLHAPSRGGKPPKHPVRAIAFLIARKIARQGTKGAHMFRDGAQAALPQARRFFSQSLRRFLQRL